MKKMKLVWLSMALIGTVVSFAACGDEDRGNGQPSVEIGADIEPEGDDKVPEGDEGVVFGAGVAAEYPISSEMQSQLDALDSNYKKVNWQVAYAPADNAGIIISETSYINTKGKNHLVVAYTNLTDEGVSMSFEGYAQNVSGDVVKDLVETDVELGPKTTIVRDVDFENDEPSGEINWKSFSVGGTSEEYIPYEMTSELIADNKGDYSIQATIEADVIVDSDPGVGFVLDEDGNIIEGASELMDYEAKFYTDSFGGRNADVVFFANIYKSIVQ
ncbi:MAG: hypothetical protein J6Y02_23010 [Pseudobutyrivibrio sp.]|nr:hypothetical protein [Pseudobutyrivibrio sp.]